MNDNIAPSSESPPLRSTILSSFLRGRPRVPSQHNITIDPNAAALSQADSAAFLPPTSPGMVNSARRRHGSPAAAAGHSNGAGGGGGNNSTSVPPTPISTTSAGLGLTQMLRRRRSGNNVAAAAAAAAASSAPLPPPGGNTNGGNNHQPQPAAPAAAATASSMAPGSTNVAVYRIRLVPQLESRRSLRFDPINRTLKAGDPVLRIGRFTDRSGLGLASLANATSSSKLAFKSKVVSRAHAEIWVDEDGKFWIKDTKSSSGTFLNHIRLSVAGTESKPYPIRDGDILQLGVDYQGGTEDIYKSVKIRIEVGREWQRGANVFNTNALKNLKSLANVDPLGKAVQPAISGKAPTTTAIGGIPDCCICLFPVSIRQAIFLAPCSHAFHYKCVRPLILAHFPAFSCPLCRTFADLEEDVEVDEEELGGIADMLDESVIAAVTPGDVAALRVITAAAHNNAIAAVAEEDEGGDEGGDEDDGEDDEYDVADEQQHARGGGAETEVETDFSPATSGSRRHHHHRNTMVVPPRGSHAIVPPPLMDVDETRNPFAGDDMVAMGMQGELSSGSGSDHGPSGGVRSGREDVVMDFDSSGSGSGSGSARGKRGGAGAQAAAGDGAGSARA